MNGISPLVLKGHHILAQGNALGWRTVVKFVRVKKTANEYSKIRTKSSIHNFLSDNLPRSVRKRALVLNNMLSQTVSYAPLLPRALPWAIIFWPLRPKNDLLLTWIVNSFEMSKIKQLKLKT